MEDTFNKVYERVWLTTKCFGYGLVAMTVIYYMYLWKLDNLLPLFDETKLDEFKILSVGLSQITGICLLPYALSRLVWRVEQIDYVDKLANPHRLKRILKAQDMILTGIHFSCFLTCAISCFGAYITTLPLPIAAFGIFLIIASMHAKHTN